MVVRHRNGGRHQQDGHMRPGVARRLCGRSCSCCLASEEIHKLFHQPVRPDKLTQTCSSSEEVSQYVQEKGEHFNMSKADVRTACRKRWGKDWYKVHPVIKKARIPGTWAAGGDPEVTDNLPAVAYRASHAMCLWSHAVPCR